MKEIEFNFNKTEYYDASKNDCYAFRNGTDVRNGKSLSLGNMVGGYPVKINGVEFSSSECAYIAGAFSDNSDIHNKLQSELTECKNGLMAKRQIRRPNETIKRSDWERFNVQWMFYVVWEKCKQNPSFCKLLEDLPRNAVIIEDSTFQAGTTATIWGCRNLLLKKKLNEIKYNLENSNIYTKAEIKRKLDDKRLNDLSRQGFFEGQNIMGKILMTCKYCIENNTVPNIDYSLLNEVNIYLLGKKLNF